MLNKKLEQNQIAFATVAIAGDSKVTVRFDRGNTTPATVYGETPAVGTRVPMLWDKNHNEWVILPESSTADAGFVVSSFFDLEDTPDPPVSRKYLVYDGGLQWSNISDEADIFSFLDLTDTPNVMGNEGDILFVKNGVLVFDTPSVAGFLLAENLLAGYAIGLTLDAVTGNVTIDVLPESIEHGALGGLLNDDHPQYASSDGSGTRVAYKAERLNQRLVAGNGIGISPSDGYLDKSITISMHADLPGAGLRWNATNPAKMDVDPGFGLKLASDLVVIDTSADFVYENFTHWTGIHYHSAKVQLDNTLEFQGAQQITTTAGDLTLNPFTAIQIPNEKTIRSSVFDSSFPIAGWQIKEHAMISGQSILTIGRIQADELSVKVFVADETRVDRGDQYWTKSYGIVAENFTMPATLGGTVTVTFEDSPALTGNIFSDGDWLLFRKVDRAIGLEVASAWGTVHEPVGGADNGNGTQNWEFTLVVGPVGEEFKEGSIAIDFGQSGSALIHLSVVDDAGSPYIKLRRWTGSNPYSPANHTTYVQIGSLNSIGNSLYTPTGDGIYIRSTADESQFIVADDIGLQIRNATFDMYDGNELTVRLNPEVPSIALGNPLPSAYGQPGIWSGKYNSAYAMSLVGNNASMKFSGTTLELVGAVTKWMTGDNVTGIVDPSGPYLSIGPSNAPTQFNPFVADPAMWVGMESGAFKFGVWANENNGLSIENGIATFRGKIIVEDGDFLPAKYRPLRSSFDKGVQLEFLSTMIRLSHEDGGGASIGSLFMASGDRYDLQFIQGAYTEVDRGRDNMIVLYVLIADIDAIIDSQGTNNPLLPVLTCYATLEVDYTPTNAEIVVGYIHFTDDGGNNTKLEYIAARGEATGTVIGPDYIRTGTLSALSADLGRIDAGTIHVTHEYGDGTVGHIYLNETFNNPDRVAIAVGKVTDVDLAPFRLWYDGRMHVGNSTNYMDWDNSSLTVEGNIMARSGEIKGPFLIAGSTSYLQVTQGKIYWDGINSYIAPTHVHIAEDVTGSTVDIGNESLSFPGMIDINYSDYPDNSQQNPFRSALKARDGGNTGGTSYTTSLYVAASNIGRGQDYGQGVVSNAVDRLFYAFTWGESNTGPGIQPVPNWADGFYAHMGYQGTGGHYEAGADNINTGGYFDTTKGVGLKVLQEGIAPAAMFNLSNAVSHQPVLWATANGSSSSPIYYARLAGGGQTGFYAEVSGSGGKAFYTNGGTIDAGGGILNGIYQATGHRDPGWYQPSAVFYAGNTTQIFTMKVARWAQINVDGLTYYVPLFAYDPNFMA